MWTVLTVVHKGAEKMVGKVFTMGKELIFLHESSKGSQWHRNFNSPGGVDTVVVEWLMANGVKEIHHYDRDRNELFVTLVTEVWEKGRPQTSGGRERLFLPVEWWKRTPGRLAYAVPWIAAVTHLRPIFRPSPPAAPVPPVELPLFAK